ncbi:hypothetical protein PHYSODRAFT_517892 [Phytophthora sojae]|uniref:Uncharacterized protein n=1 Tax=Phytophthora sojae (strain P6497) TaxID=1094619 RepID=G4ZYK1_PHYSP|nr:hypothetical protein PHYSODRAFT_517892 [Phytophthora sojae]EGZ12034.1 hypothetical protein PHYSODRAFT_517892 [Phytophthora sojae]|eukprot:XP_009532367.1 hypothetical protein PHYSODRAFT_517892 [Phytophthora sojae]
MNPELGCVFDDPDHDDHALLATEVLDLPDLELLLPSGELGDELLTSLLPDDELDENSVDAMGSEEEKEGLTVSIDDPSTLTSEVKETELAARELKFLEAQRDFLQYKADAKVVDVESENEQQRAIKQEVKKEKSRLEEARAQQNMLVDVIKLHQQSAGDLHRLMIQASPLMHYRMTLMTPMESYIRLSKDPAERRSKLLEIRDEKLDVVRQFVTAQTRGIDPTRGFFYVDTFERFGKFYTVDFSVSLVNGMTVAEVAEVIQDQFVVPRDGVSRLLGCVTNRTYYDAMVDTFLHARTVERVDLPERSCDGRSFLVQESNAVFFLKKFAAGEVDESDGGGQSGEQGDLTVMMSDFVDVDELHPYHTHSRVRKDISVGITLRRHVGSDGAEGVVMRRFSFVKHHLGRRVSRSEVVNTISTRVLLWGQAVRLCIAERRRQKRDAPKRIWNTHTFPQPHHRKEGVTPAPPRPDTACAGAHQLM